MNCGVGALGVAGSLAERVREGDLAAEDELVARFHRRVYLMALARTRDQEISRDLAQDVMVGVLQGLREGRLINNEKLSAYVYGTARNLINNALRSRRLEPTRLLAIGNPQGDPGHSAGDSERRTLAREIVGNLRPPDREILQMTLVEGLKSEEVAERLGITPEAARKRKSRALARARGSIRGSHENDVPDT
jgi:RNA polymerase sigma-70 factor (ECF subfamily)